METQEQTIVGLWNDATQTLKWEVPYQRFLLMYGNMFHHPKSHVLYYVKVEIESFNELTERVIIRSLFTKYILHRYYRIRKTAITFKCILSSYYLKWAKAHKIYVGNPVWTWCQHLTHLQQWYSEVSRIGNCWYADGKLLAYKAEVQ